jgi:single-stranded-DNA-specific exonuclease
MSIVKHWQILPKISDEFVEKYPEYSRLVLQLLFNRGITGKVEIEEFLNPPTPPYQGGNFDPFLFNNMEVAVDLIIKHIKEGNEIVVYGDYDADGVTASAVLFETLTILKGKVDVYIPDRVSEGYGLNKEAIDKLKAEGASLVITVDNGIRNKSEVEYARSLGVEAIITDHHIPPGEHELPDCFIINPVVEREKYPFKYLAGVGVAFKLAQAVIQKSKLSESDKKKLEEKLLDLVAIGTVADCVTAFGENRILIKKGLVVLNGQRRIGLNTLIKIAQINNNKKLDAWNISFQIAPRLNSAGRMEHANTAFELLTTKNKEEAETIVRWLNEKNYDRQKTTDEIFENIVKRVDKQVEDGKLGYIIVAVSPSDEIWNEGVIGLVAGKISDKYYRPTLVITRSEDGTLKGSGRSIEEFNIIQAVEECSEFLEKFGGHAQACGLSLKEENLEKFGERIKKIVTKKLKGLDLRPKIEIEDEMELGEIDEHLLNEVEKFSPFGQDNERPKFLSQNVVIVDKFNMGIDGQHIKLRLKGKNFGIISALGFGQSEDWGHLRIGDKIDIVYYVEMNEYNGRREIQLKIVDIKTITNNP